MVVDKRMSLKNAWYIVAREHELGESPLAVELLGERLVLFRSHGSVAVLQDRCIHRNVRLSRGRVDRGEIECAYHGWRFNAEGVCVAKPSCLASETCTKEEYDEREGTHARRVPHYSARVHQGDIWVTLADPAPAFLPPAVADGPEYVSFTLETIVDCPQLYVLENFVDCAHTNFVHAGTFRGAPSTRVRSEIRDTHEGVFVETFGESGLANPIVKLLLTPDEAIRHTDEYLAPHTVRVNYYFGTKRHVQSHAHCTPINDRTTKIFSRIVTKFPPITALLLHYFKRTTRQILDEDKRILDDQGENLHHYKKSNFSWTTPDTACLFVTRAHRAFEANKFPLSEPKSEHVEFLL
jgi:phenylpropionate dioxygenase-like ring-hydroxylating dioxygenase large terminal subunit